MTNGSQENLQLLKECEPFILREPDGIGLGRFFELCTGQSHSSRQAPSYQASTDWRRSQGLEPLPPPEFSTGGMSVSTAQIQAMAAGETISFPPMNSWKTQGRPGHHLHKVFEEVGQEYKTGCGCSDVAAQMDNWGIELCLDNENIICESLDKSAAKLSLWEKISLGVKALAKGYLFDLNAKGFFLEAIRRARMELEELNTDMSKMKWAYGITTVRQRLNDLLPQTIKSLAAAGFDNPRLFIDGEKLSADWDHFNLETTTHFPSMLTFGNWFMALSELNQRHPYAQRYALFQDDFVTYLNLRDYLERCEYPDRGYWNLFTFPQNQNLIGDEHRGWFKSGQNGLGAVALVFDRETVETLLTSPRLIQRPRDANGHWNIDGGIVSTLKRLGWSEYCHSPSLVQHTGTLSSIRSRPQPIAPLFFGEEYNALELLPSRKS